MAVEKGEAVNFLKISGGFSCIEAHFCFMIRNIRHRHGERKVFVSQMTKQALEASLKKLLLHKPLNKITINDITEDCGVNRMTFYYHFKDIYDLVEWILERDAARLMENDRSFDTLRDAFYTVLLRVQANKTIVMNLCRALRREQVEQYLYRLMDPIMHDFADQEGQGLCVSETDKQFVLDFYKYAMVGMMLEWIRCDLKTDPAELAQRLDTMMHGELRRALGRFDLKQPTRTDKI